MGVREDPLVSYYKSIDISVHEEDKEAKRASKKAEAPAEEAAGKPEAPAEAA